MQRDRQSEISIASERSEDEECRPQSVQVAVRVRPMNDREMKSNTTPVVNASSEKGEVTLVRGMTGQRHVRQTYNFDSVFTSFSSQEEVFETVRPLVNEVMCGYEATVFAYGQTGTGKTHTMEGDLKSEEQKGIIPRAVEAIFERLSNPKYTQSSVVASYLEIYNEELSDLLLKGSDQPASHGFGAPAAGVHKPPSLNLIAGHSGVFVQNLSEHKVDNPADVLALIGRAQERRRVGETKMNKHSSRSHCVFTLVVSSQAPTPDGGVMECKGKLHLVDLAGSECAKTAGGSATDGRERERKNINQSLLVLGRVISMLRDRERSDKPAERIPYRDSKLTRLLQESLGGRCKTVVVATLSPSILAVEESFSTLNYAQKAQGITNKPMATSFFRVGQMAGAMGKAPAGAEDAKDMQDWHAMLLRMSYLEEQANEAASKLARKTMQQAEIIARAEAAEAAKAEAEVQVEEERAESARLAAELSAKEVELQATSYVLQARRDTERQLGAQANGLVAELRASENDAAALHAALADAAATAEAHKAAREAMAGQVGSKLNEVRDGVVSMLRVLAAQREAAAEAAAKADEEAMVEAENARAAADRMADGGKEAMEAATTAVETAATAAENGLRATAQAARTGLDEAAAKAAAAQARVESQLDALSAKLAESEEALRAWFESTAARQTEARSALGEGGEATIDALNEVAAAAAKRLDASKERADALCAALSATLERVRGVAATEEKLESAIVEMRTRDKASSEGLAKGLNSCAAAVKAASDAQASAQADVAVVAAVESAAEAVERMVADANSAQQAQQAELAAAAREVREGDACVRVVAAARGACAEAAAALAAREEDMAAQQAELARQRQALADMAAAQESMRGEMMDEVMASMKEVLSRQLFKLAGGVESSVAAATGMAKTVETALSTAVAKAAASHEQLSVSCDEIVGLSEGWSARGVEATERVAEAGQLAEQVQATLKRGAQEARTAHSEATAQATSWRDADVAWRDAVGEAVEEQGKVAAKHAKGSEAQQGRMDCALALLAAAAAETKGVDEEVASATSMGQEMGAHAVDAKELGRSDTAGVVWKLANVRDLGAEVLDKETKSLREMEAARPAAHAAAVAMKEAAAAEGAAAVEEVTTSLSSCATAVEAAATTEAARWAALVGERDAHAKRAFAAIEEEKEAVATAALAHARVLERSAAERTRRVEAHAAEANALAGSAQHAPLDGAESSLRTFVAAAKEAEAVAYDSQRAVHVFEEELACTPQEAVLREHFLVHGDVPFGRSSRESALCTHTGAAGGTPRGSSGEPRVADAKENAGARNLPSPKAFDGVELAKAKVSDLRKMLDERNLPTDGQKAELIARLTKQSSNGVFKIPKAPTPGRTPRRPRSEPLGHSHAKGNGADVDAASGGAPNSQPVGPSGGAKNGSASKARKSGLALKEINSIGAN